uniref:Poly(A) RNA polymerase mitochondrial-like central palm domain-containing protein n=1 Tax=Leersia perrieri TaxID=77586 RepID=A0A0D9V7R0_9ORYZ
MSENSNYDVAEQCIKSILSLIKPVEDDKRKRLSAIQELSNSIPQVAALRGDLDISLQLPDPISTITKKKKQNVLRQLMRTLQNRGVAGYVQFIAHARVPVLQYVSNTFGIPCDISVNNYSGRIKSKIFYWISTLDARFGDMVLLIKEWAKAQNINDPKTGTLNSYSLCLLVLYHFQTCEPAILPPLKEIYEGNIEDIAETTMYDEEHLDEVCSANLAKFKCKNNEQRNESSLCHLLATFFHKVEDPIERPDNAARAVGLKGLERIARAFSAANRKFASLQRANRNDLLEMLCTPAVGSKLGIRVSQEVMANSYTNTPPPRRNRQHARPMRHLSARPSDNQNHRGTRGYTVDRQVDNPPRVYDTVRQSTGVYHNHNHQHAITSVSQPAGIYQTVAPYQNNSHPPPYQSNGHPPPYQSNSHPQVYTRNLQTVGYQNYSHPTAHTTRLQTVEPYQSYSQPQVRATSIQAPRQYQNHSQQRPARNYNHQSLHATATETEGSYRNQQQQRQHTSGRQTNRNAVTARYVPVVARPQNGPADSRSRAQDSSGSAPWQQWEPPTGSAYQNR